MTLQSVLLPLFVLVVLTFVLMVWAAYLRVQALRSRAVAPRDVALREPNWPPHVLQVMYAFQNQLELPLLFYVLTILALITKQADLLFVLMAWVFVALRVLHAAVHVTDNDFKRRGLLFIAGAVVLAAMWTIYMLRILLS
ncbi:MAG: MAPEG family protein [Xanthobacteraceae bacterium]